MVLKSLACGAMILTASRRVRLRSFVGVNEPPVNLDGEPVYVNRSSVRSELRGGRVELLVVSYTIRGEVFHLSSRHASRERVYEDR